MTTLEYLGIIFGVAFVVSVIAVLLIVLKDILLSRQAQAAKLLNAHHDSLPIFTFMTPSVPSREHKPTDRRCICRLTDMGWFTKDCALHNSLHIPRAGDFNGGARK